MKPGSKHQLPLQLLKALEKIYAVDKGNFLVIEPDDSFLLIKDVSSASDFFFHINSAYIRSPTFRESFFIVGIQDKSVFFEYSQKPTSRYEVKVTNYKDIDTKSLIERMKEWMLLVKSYESVSILSDPILEQYEKEFYKEFKLADEDADTHSFPTQTQKLIDSYTEKIAEKLESYKMNSHISQEKKDVISSIIQDVNALRDNQTQMTKNQVVKGLTNIFAKCKKAGLKVLEEVRTEVVKEIVKHGVKALLDNPNDYLGFFTDISS